MEPRIVSTWVVIYVQPPKGLNLIRQTPPHDSYSSKLLLGEKLATALQMLKTSARCNCRVLSKLWLKSTGYRDNSNFHGVRREARLPQGRRYT